MWRGGLISLLFFQLQHLTGGQAQILYKGYLGAYEGGGLSYCNALSAVGNVLGRLSLWLIGWPLLLWAPILLLLAMRLVGFLLFDAVIRQVFEGRGRGVIIAPFFIRGVFYTHNLEFQTSKLFFIVALVYSEIVTSYNKVDV